MLVRVPRLTALQLGGGVGSGQTSCPTVLPPDELEGHGGAIGVGVGVGTGVVVGAGVGVGTSVLVGVAVGCDPGPTLKE